MKNPSLTQEEKMSEPTHEELAEGKACQRCDSAFYATTPDSHEDLCESCYIEWAVALQYPPLRTPPGDQG